MPTTQSLRSLGWPLRWFYLGTMAKSLGFGLTLVLFTVYLHNVRHLSVPAAGLTLAYMAVIGLAVAPAIGTLTDRYGPWRIIAVCTVTGSGTLVSFAFADSLWWILVTATLFPVTLDALWGPSTVLLTRVVPEDVRQRAFGFNFMLLNVGIGLGGLLSASVVNLDRPMSFTALYLGTAGLQLLSLIFFVPIRRLGGPADAAELADEETGGWRQVIADRRLVYFLGVSLLLMTFGYGSLDAGLSLFAVNQLHLALGDVAISLSFNTAAIVAAQVVVLRLLEGRSRSLSLAVLCGLWGSSWVLIWLAAGVGPSGALLLLGAGCLIFGVGETLWSPLGPALVNEFAPDHLRGRYNASLAGLWNVAALTAPLLAGAMLGNSAARFWPLVLAGGLGLTAIGFVRMRQRLSPAEDGRQPAGATTGS
jgi:MFS family permease